MQPYEKRSNIGSLATILRLFQMGRSERPTLFACYRAAGMMKALFVLCSDAIRFVLTGVSQLDVT